MMSINVTVTTTKDEERQASLIIRKIAYDAQAEMIDLLRGPKTGRVYRRRGRSHQASAPGEAPAIMSGALLNAASQSVSFPSPLTAEISIPVEYAEALEFGSRDIAERPFVRPALETVFGKLQNAGVISGFDRLL